MGVVALKGSRVITGLLATTTPRALANPGLAGGRLRVWSETVEVGSADSATSTYHMARLPSNARLFGLSKWYWDDLASAGSPTLDLGLFNPTGLSGGTDDSTTGSVTDGADAATVNAVGTACVKDPAKMGKRLWEIWGLSADPRQEIDVKVMLLDADVNVGGTVTVELVYSLD